MAALDDLLARIDDVSLRADIERELVSLRGDQELGLVFERHLPEKVRLPGLPVRRGTTVEMRADQCSPTWQVVRLSDGAAEVRRRGDDGTTITETRPVADLVVVREFGQPIYPGLRSVGRIEHGGDKPFHTVINSENYHALETLLYTCEGKADVIYIDPPYNTGARDWKYNNDYVDGNDGYRHSKWLSFMEKRLVLAKRLLNPDCSVLIVTIDEKEYLRLGMLLEQVFPAGRIQMVTAVTNPRAGVDRPDAFTRTEEYVYFVQLGASRIAAAVMSGDEAPRATSSPIWFSLMRTGSNSSRRARPKLFYPVWVTPDNTLHSVGDALAFETDRVTVTPPHPNLRAVWPLRPSGEENCWQLGPAALRAAFTEGTARISASAQRPTVNYLRAAEKRRIAAGEIDVLGKDPSGALVLQHREGVVRLTRPRTVWSSSGHDAGLYGSQLLGKLVPGRKFPFPKSLYAVEDTLRFVIADKPEALVIDFFGGSGTTTHAVMRLNHQDGGRRRSILVTNNEIGPEAEKELTARGLTSGHPEWESLGIFEHITKPRIEAAATGVTHEGKPVVGDYKFTDEFPMSEGFAENLEFFTLTYEDPDMVQLGVAFESVAPLLWLMAGATGPRVNTVADSWSLPDGGRYGVLFDADAWPSFTEAVKDRDGLTHVFVVTDSDAVFQRVVAELPDTVTSVRLYESYLRSFAINTGA